MPLCWKDRGIKMQQRSGKSHWIRCIAFAQEEGKKRYLHTSQQRQTWCKLRKSCLDSGKTDNRRQYENRVHTSQSLYRSNSKEYTKNIYTHTKATRVQVLAYRRLSLLDRAMSDPFPANWQLILNILTF